MAAFLQWTAWTMTTPPLYGAFHLLFFIVGTAAAVGLALLLYSFSDRITFNQVIGCTGLLLAVGEIYKQLFYYYILNEHSYDWWLFPFQLCSLPMYLCLALPFIHQMRLRKIICTFLVDFNMMGAIAAFIDPSGILHGYWTLTLHGLLWHLLLIFVGIYILLMHQADLTPAGFRQTLPLFAVFSAIAEILNIVLHRMGTVNLFYISPYVPSTQLIFKDIDRLLGRPAGIILYLIAILAGAGLIHAICSLCNARRPHQINAH